jgi:hypothetical protein
MAVKAGASRLTEPNTAPNARPRYPDEAKIQGIPAVSMSFLNGDAELLQVRQGPQYAGWRAMLPTRRRGRSRGTVASPVATG